MQTALLDRKKWRTRIELSNAIFQNGQRPHTAVTMRTPIAYEMIQISQQPVA
jgi:hypothetical protein